MNKFAKAALIIGGSAVAAAAASALALKSVIDEAMDREEPKIIRKIKPKVMDAVIDTEAFNNAVERSHILEETVTERIEILAPDGTSLIGHFYPAENPERIILAMHGWRSSWSIDFSGIAAFWHANGCSVLFAEQRGQGESGGAYIGFGLTERFDCLAWAEWLAANKSDTLPIYLAGVSMGATTVLMASGCDLPTNVRGIIADCGFTSAEAVWKHVAEDTLHVPYPVVRPAVNKFCYDKLQCMPDDYSTLSALAVNKKPVLFIHGDADDFVPVSMTYENYEACTAPKEIYIVPGARHGMSYATDTAGYQLVCKMFWAKYDK